MLSPCLSFIFFFLYSKHLNCVTVLPKRLCVYWTIDYFQAKIKTLSVPILYFIAFPKGSSKGKEWWFIVPTLPFERAANNKAANV